MIGRVVLASFALLAASCIPGERDNPFDPQGNVEPSIQILQPYAITCGQWQGDYPLPPGFDPSRLSPEESSEIDNHCAGACVLANVPCQYYEVLTSQVKEPIAACSPGHEIVELRYNEILYQSDEERRIEIVLPNAADLRFDESIEGGFYSIDPDDSGDSESDHFEYGSRYQAIDGEQVTAAAWQAFRDKVLLSRQLYSVDRNTLAITLSDGFGNNITGCRVEVKFDQATDILSHPLAFAGGYGRSVAVADLPLPDDYEATISRLDYATTYSAAEDKCWIDVVFRDSPSGNLVHAPQEGTFYGLSVACDADGQPPSVVSGRFLESPLRGEAFAAPYRAEGEELYISLFGPDHDAGEPIEIDSPEYFEVPGFPGVPRELECIGDLVGDSRDDVALVSVAGTELFVCTPANVDGNCALVPAPQCLGAPAKWLDIAGKPHDVEVTEILAAIQSSNGSCVIWMDASAGYSVTREETFSTLEPVTVQWATLGGSPSAIAVGYLDPASPASMALELPPTGEPVHFTTIYDQSACTPTMTARSDGLGASVLTETILECASDGSGCDVYSFRALGLPKFEYATDYDLDGVFEVVPDEGTIAYWGFGCGDPANVYYPQGLPFLGDIYPTSIGASLAAALDPSRSRQASSTICQVPSTLVMGAPADGPLGGTGRMVVIYNSGDTFRTEPFCTPVIP